MPELLLHESKAGYTVKHNVDAWMSEIAATTSIALEEASRYLDVSTFSLNGYRPYNVGFGISYTLPVVVSLLQSAALKGKGKESYFLAIENPEAHLHPQGQTAMGRLLALTANSGVQLLVETHSDYILDGIRLSVKDKLKASDAKEKIIYFFEKKDFETKVTKIEITESGTLTSWPKGFFDQGRKNKAKLLG